MTNEGDTIETYYRGKIRKCEISVVAPKRSKKMGEPWRWLICNDSDIGNYYRKFMKPERLLKGI